MNTKWIWLGVSFFSSTAGAVIVPDFSAAFLSGVLTIAPPPAHHFNLPAPHRVKRGQVKVEHQLTESALIVKLTKEMENQDLNVSVFVCDQAKTFCLKKEQVIKVPIGASVPSKKNSESIGKKNHVIISGAAPAHLEKSTGFFVNDPDRAFAEAKLKKLPLVIDFFGIWCPPCNHLDAMVFKSREFKKWTQGRFVLLKLDSDEVKFSALKDRYQVQGLPTTVFATPEGDEIVRLLGYHPLNEFKTQLDFAHAHRTEGFAAIAAKADTQDVEAKKKAAAIALDRGEYERALAWLKGLESSLHDSKDPALALLYKAELGVAQKKNEDSRSREILEKWMNAFPKSVDQVENASTLADLYEQASETKLMKESLLKGVQLTHWLAANPTHLERSEYTIADLAQARAGLLERLGDSEEFKRAYLECANQYDRQARAEGKSFARGPQLEKAYCLAKSGKLKESEAIYVEGIRKFPKEYTFYAGLARLMLDTGKDPKRALESSERALEYAYGAQRLKVTATRAKAYEAMGEFKKAIQAIDQELPADAPGSASISQTKLRQKLVRLRSDLEQKALKK